MMHTYLKCMTLLVCLLFSFQTYTQEITLEHIATYHTGLFAEGAAEIAAYDETGKQLFFVNANAATVDVLDISNPANPQLVKALDCTPYGAAANSVAIHSGIVAVAIENTNKQENGRVVFFDTEGNYLNDVEAGALPDMLTFTSDGMKVIVANEGEPNDDYTIDPEGSVTIIDLSGGVSAATATQIYFTDYNDKKMSLINRGVRIFGNGGTQTVAQDLEPEYIAISEDNSWAYVACQEANALAVVNINSATIVDILPLGYKDHNKGAPQLKEYLLNEIPWWNVFDLGKPLYGGDVVELGGFSGLCFDPYSSTSNQWSFWTVPDRGPNENPISAAEAGSTTDLRPYKLPDYQARLVKLNYIKSLDMFFPDANQIYLKRQDGTPISGKGNIPGHDETPVTRTDDNVYTNVDFTVNGDHFHELDFDAFGGDFEGVIRTPDFHFWLCDENRPAIYHFDENGTLVERYVPHGTSLLGTTPQTAGFYGKETLPSVYNKRWANRGFEAIAYDHDEDIIYAFIQSPIDNPNRATVRNKSDVIRIIGIRREDGEPVKEFVYLLERNRDAGVGISRVDKIGDAVYAGNGIFYVLERDSSDPLEDNTGKKYIYEIRTEGATNILGTNIATKDSSTGPTDKTLEMMTAEDLALAGISPVHKTKVTNLPSLNYTPSDKPEGLAILPNGDLAVLNDNDFGLAGAGISDKSSFGFLQFQKNYGIDASDRTDEIEIKSHPVMGMFLPDAIATLSINGKQFIITANEGDSRDYDGYSEEERVKDLVLDPASFPNSDALQKDSNIGRLKTTSADGDIDQDGMHEIIYSFGGRSFSIWDATGNLVYDSGNDIEQRLAVIDPEHFNSTNDDNDSFKNRSDDKGPEPEAVTLAHLNGENYAFIGLERMGGIMTYNISNPYAPHFVGYTNNRNFEVDAATKEAGDLGPEDILFIEGAKSPNGAPLVVTANEVSGSISIFGIGDGSRPGITLRENLDFTPDNIYIEGVYPNPFNTQLNVAFHLENNGEIEIEILNALGQLQLSQNIGERTSSVHQTKIDFTEKLLSGNYWITIKQNGNIVRTFSAIKR